MKRGGHWSRKYPQLGTAPLPTEPYVSEGHFALERDRVFRRSWLNVGRVEEIPGAGDYFVREVAVCHASVLVIRGSDGIVRGFHNVCSHRGNTLAPDNRGSCGGALRCGFHNWAFSDKGELIGVPEEENFFDLDKREHGLTPVDTDVWEGFIFVHLDPDPVATLREYLGGVADRLDGCPFGELQLLQAYTVEENANWKVALDAQNEVYHLPFQHRRTLGDAYARNEDSNSRFTDFTLYGRHSLWSGNGNRSWRLTPLKVSLFLSGDNQPEHRTSHVNGDINHFNIFPNTVLTLYHYGNMTNLVTYNFWPIAVDRTIWEIRFYFREPATIHERFRQEYVKCLIRQTLQEDTAAHESVHAGVASRARSHIVLQDDEAPIRHFHKVLAEHAGHGECA